MGETDLHFGGATEESRFLHLPVLACPLGKGDASRGPESDNKELTENNNDAWGRFVGRALVNVL